MNMLHCVSALVSKLKQKKGTAIVIALIVVFMITAFAVAYINMTTTGSKAVASSINYNTAAESALAGFDMARAVLVDEHTNGWDDELTSSYVNSQNYYITQTPIAVSTTFTPTGFQWVQNISYAGGYFMAQITNNLSAAEIALGGTATNDTDDMVILTVTSTLLDGSQSQVQALVHYKSPFYAPTAAIVTGGALTLGGNSQVLGSNGNIYASGAVTIGGSASVSQDVYTPGTITGGDPDNNHPGSPAPDIPPIDPSAYSNLADYELRVNGDVYSKTLGSVIGTADNTTAVAGWKYKSSTSTWRNDGTPPNGTFYVVNGNISVSGAVGTGADPWHATLLVMGTPGTPPTNGTITLQGTGGTDVNMVPDEDSICLMALGNIDIGGNFGTEGGLVASNEQINITGNADINGSILAASHTLGVNGVSVTETGSAIVEYNGGMITIISAGSEYAEIKGFKKLK